MQQQHRINVMILDDHPVVRESYALGLEREADISICGTYATVLDLRTALQTICPDVLLMDFNLGPSESDGIQLIRSLAAQYPRMRILLISGYCTPATVMLAMQTGATGFVSKSQTLQVVSAAVRAVHAGRPWISGELELVGVERFLRSKQPVTGSLADNSSLSARESEVLRCCLQGMSVTEIAEKFNKSVNTISTQKQSAFRKLGVRNNLELYKVQHLLNP